MGLFHAYLPPIAFGALFRDSEQLAQTPYETVRSDMDRLLAQAEADAADIPEEGRREALFAVCAFVDEALLTSAWQDRGRWARETLQRTRFGTVNAGTEFYDHCRALLRATSAPGLSLASPVAAGQDAGTPPGADSLLPPADAGSPPPPSSASRPGGEKRFSDYLLSRNREHGKNRFSLLRRNVRAGAPLPPGTSLDLVSSSAEQRAPAAPTAAWREEALCLYGACLSMGFTGQYYDSTEREKLYSLALAALERAVGGRVSPHQRRITPEVYCMPETEPVRPAPRIMRLLLVLLPALLTILLYAAYDHTLSAYVAEWLAGLASGRL